jgi:PITH domain
MKSVLLKLGTCALVSSSLPECVVSTRALAGRGGSTPRRLRLYANHANIIDFSEVEDVQPALNISLLEGEIGVTEYPLRMAAFSSINSLSLFFVRHPPNFCHLQKKTSLLVQSDSVGEESTRIYYIGFKGETRITRKEGSSKLEIPAANAADSTLTDTLREKSAAQQPTAK